VTKKEWDKLRWVNTRLLEANPFLNEKCDCGHVRTSHYIKGYKEWWGENHIPGDLIVGAGECGSCSKGCKEFSEFANDVARMRRELELA